MGKLEPTRCELGRQLWAAVGDPSTDLTGKLTMLAAMLRRGRELPEREVRGVPPVVSA